MAFILVQAGSALQAVDLDGTILETLTLPTGVTINPLVRGHFAILGRQVVFVTAPSVNLWIDPATLTVRPLSVLQPTAAPVLTAGSGTGITGSIRVKVSYTIKDENGALLSESAPGPASAAIVLANTGLHIASIPRSLTGIEGVGRRLYRTVAGGSVFFKFADVDEDVSETYDTNLTDASLELLPIDPGLGNPPGALPGTHMRILTVWRNRLWGFSDVLADIDKLYYSQLDTFYAWKSTGFLTAQPAGEDSYGGTGLVPRRDELIVCKRTRIMKVVGTTEDDFEVIILAEGVGCLAPDSVVVVRDIGYFLGIDGVYRVGPEGVENISRDQVDPWFQTDRFFNRSEFPNATAGYNPVTDTYDLHLCSAGQTTINRWISYDIRRRCWLGPHLTTAYVPTARGMLQDEASSPMPTFGSSTGFLLPMNAAGASDDGTAIAIDWVTKPFVGRAPDIQHFWQQGTLHIKRQGATAGAITVTPAVGAVDALVTQTAIAASQRVDRFPLPAPSKNSGEALSLRFQHAIDAEDVEIRGFELPFVEVGRRTPGQ